jgi:MFS transporter, FSR family, fosmidomycin resistance protein
MKAIKKRTLGACCGAHILHDGYTDLLYLMFPIWQMAFGLSLAEVGSLKTLYSGAMASLQVPSSMLSEKVGEKQLLLFGTLVAAIGFLLSGWTTGFLGLAACLILSGIGASVQHPLSSSLTSHAFEGPELRGALSTYNFSGDIGKVILPSLCAALLAIWDWHTVTSVMGLLGLLAVIFLAVTLPKARVANESKDQPDNAAGDTGVNGERSHFLNLGFISLSSIAVIDSATRVGFLTLLPFLLMSKGATLTQVGFALSLTFAGGAAGKFVCGFIAARFGVIKTTLITEIATTILIVLTLVSSVDIVMLILPLVGVALNGTSSGLYGTVPELVPSHMRSRAFGVFYTLTIGAGAISPIMYGFAGDSFGVSNTIALIAGSVLLVLPLTLGLKKAFRRLEIYM